jgi:cell wall-associated NlpC family hydrolase
VFTALSRHAHIAHSIPRPHLTKRHYGILAGTVLTLAAISALSAAPVSAAVLSDPQPSTALRTTAQVVAIDNLEALPPKPAPAPEPAPAPAPEPTPAAAVEPEAVVEEPAPVVEQPAPAATSYDGTLGSAIVAAASTAAGLPYVFGAAGPYAYDCSGLVVMAYAQVGISLPHSATAQGAYGYAVSQSEAQPGDLILFGSPGAYYHVGIYAGGGQMWAAPQAGDVVKLQAIWTDAYDVRRLI